MFYTGQSDFLIFKMVIVYCLFTIAVIIFYLSILKYIRALRTASKEYFSRTNKLFKRFLSSMIYLITQWASIKHFPVGLIHMVFFYVFLLYLIDFLWTGLSGGLSPRVLLGQGLADIYSSALYIAAIIFILALFIFFAILLFTRPRRLEITADMIFIFTLVFLIMLTRVCFKLSQGIVSEIFWWLYLIVRLITFTSFPYTGHLHLITAPFNIFFRNFGLKKTLSLIDLEKSETLGVSKLQEFSWKQLLDHLSCVQCGRCQEACPVYLTGKPLSPKKFMRDIEVALRQGVSSLDEVVKADEIWSCTTCGACMQNCSLFVEHVDKFVDLRRFFVLTKGEYTEELGLFFKNMELYANPWGFSKEQRGDWAKDLDVKVVSDAGETSILYWPGCCGAYDSRDIEVARSVANLLKIANIDFAILSTQELCCGEPLRRTGNEYLYQEFAKQNIQKLKSIKFEKILTHCPHCYNTLKNEYKQLNGNFEVVHTTEFFYNLLASQRLKLSKKLDLKITYHDPCYLARYNSIYKEPREILKMITLSKIIEARQRKRHTFCCGGGGGRVYMEERAGKRINIERFEELTSKDVDVIAVSCPFCLTMFEDATKVKDMQTKVKPMDIAELVSRCV